MVVEMVGAGESKTKVTQALLLDLVQELAVGRG